MTLSWKLAIPIAVAVATSTCAPPETEMPQTAVETTPQAVGESAPASEQPDPTVVDSDHYKVEFENDRVRVVRITYGPGEESVMHYHPDHVAVFLTDMHGEFRFPDGTTQEVHLQAGEHMLAPAGLHQPRNTADQPLEVVAVELKSARPGAATTASEADQDPTVVDSDHYAVEFENERVRVLRITYGPGEESIMHDHPEHVGVFLTDMHGEFRFPDGTTQEVHGQAGDYIVAPAGLHQPRNTADQPFELVAVELK